MTYSLPDEPDHTCPLIDEVLEWMGNFDLVKKDFTQLTINELEDAVLHYKDNINIMQSRMEEIRSANDALRQRQDFFREGLEKMEEELETVRADLESAEERAAERQAMLEEYERTAPL